jgi:hypothetical protein
MAYVFSPTYASVPANAADVAVKTAAGVLFKVVVLAAGAGITAIQDAATGHAGTVLLNIPATPTVGQIYTLECAVTLGITVVGNAANSGLLITFA